MDKLPPLSELIEQQRRDMPAEAVAAQLAADAVRQGNDEDDARRTSMDELVMQVTDELGMAYRALRASHTPTDLRLQERRWSTPGRSYAHEKKPVWHDAWLMFGESGGGGDVGGGYTSGTWETTLALSNRGGLYLSTDLMGAKPRTVRSLVENAVTRRFKVDVDLPNIRLGIARLVVKAERKTRK